IFDDLDRGVDQIFAEAQTLRQLDHPAIIRIQDCGFASPSDDSRPYLVMDYFHGATLEEAAREKPLAVEDALAVARLIAEGLHAAHARNILHRDIKPANVLVHKGDSWQVQLLAFGLALKRSGLETMRATTHTLSGSSIAGTLDYAAPEQMGKLPGATVRPCSDIYGFARTCCYALFQTPQPLLRHWRSIPAQLAELLESCLEDQPAQRPQDFRTVLEKLAALSPKPAKSVSAPTPPPSPAPVQLPVVADQGGSSSTKPVAEMTRQEREQELASLALRVSSCTRCSQLARSRTQTVFGEGPLDPELCLIGEAP